MSPSKARHQILCNYIYNCNSIDFNILDTYFKKAFYWNQCFKKTTQWIDKKDKELKNWDKASKESIAVAVCNGAVYEPKFKRKKSN